MTPQLRGLIITALVALTAGFSGVGLGKLVFHRAERQLTLHEVIHEQLRLTVEQARQIEVLETSYAERRHAQELEMRAANVELAAAIREEQGYGPRVTAAIERFHGAMGRLQTAMIQHVFAMRAVLTDEQKAIFDNTVVAALTTEPQ